MLKSNQPKIDALNAKMANARALRALSQTEGWAIMEDLLRGGIEARKDRMLSSKCDYDEIRVHRSVIEWTQNILRAPDISDDEMGDWAGEVAFLTEQENMRKSLIPNEQGAAP